MKFLLSTILFISTFAVYLPTRHFDFVDYDDISYVRDNAILNKGLTPAGIRWAFFSTYYGNWYPLTWLSHMLDCQLFGVKPGYHHLVNVLFHAANSVILFLLLSAMTGCFWRSCFVGALFALHPLHVESVAWISERKDVLSTFFGLLCLWAYYCWQTRGEWRSRTGEIGSDENTDAGSTHAAPAVRQKRCHSSKILYGASLMFFVLGLMAKPMVISIPILMLLIDFWPLKRIGFPEGRLQLTTWVKSKVWPLLREKLLFFVFVPISAALTLYAESSGGTPTSIAAFTLLDRLINATNAYLVYIVKTLCPVNLAIIYPLSKSIPIWRPLLAAAVLLFITICAVKFQKRHSYLLMGWLWFVITLVPVIGLVHVGAQAYADRYTYVPHIGLFIMIVWGISDLLLRYKVPRSLATCAALMVLGACAFKTAAQIECWENSVTLFQNAVDNTRRNPFAETSLGVALFKIGDEDTAISHLEKAVRLAPYYDHALDSLGVAYLKQKKYKEALKQFLKLEKLAPTAELNTRLGVTYLQLKEYEKAAEYLKKGHDHSPDGRRNLAIALTEWAKRQAAAGEFAAAREKLAKAKEAFPEHRDIHLEMALLEEALTVNPDHIDSLLNLGSLMLQTQRYDEAVTKFKNVLELQPTNETAKKYLEAIERIRKSGLQ